MVAHNDCLFSPRASRSISVKVVAVVVVLVLVVLVLVLVVVIYSKYVLFYKSNILYSADGAFNICTGTNL